MANQAYQVALKYLEIGLSPVALCSPRCSCKSKGKVPHTEGWQAACAELPSEDELRADFARLRGNVGIATGPASGVTVIDCDSEAAYSWFVEEYRRREGQDLQTPLVRTGRGTGYHLYFQYTPEAVSGEPVIKGHNFEVKSEGRQVVAPPSLHESGRLYEWLRPFDYNALEPVPQWFIEAMKTSSTTKTTVGEGDISEGERNTRLFKMACALRHHGASQASIEVALLAENTARCKPPLSESEVRKIAAQAAKYQPEDGNGRNDHHHTGRNGDTSQHAKDESETSKLTVEAALTEIGSLPDRTREAIQKRLWDLVKDASQWSKTEIGRFCDVINTEYGLAKIWLADWRKAIASEKRKRWAKTKTAQQAASNGHLPTIITTDRHMRDVTADALSAVEEANNSEPFLFVRGGQPTRVVIDEHGNAIAKPLTVSAMRGIYERTANFVSETVIDGALIQKPINPPLDNVNDLLSLGDFNGLPKLVGISTAPVVAPDGTICTDRGYQAASGYYYHATGDLAIGDTTPTEANLQKAKALILNEMLGDFPFVDDASKAHTVGLMLAPFVRPLVDGPTPLHGVDASTPGTGKTLLADVATMPFAPNGPTIMTAARNDEELRKRITAKLTSAPPHILFDNVKGKLTSGDLAAALTVKNEWEDRLLGTSTTVRLPVRSTWIATGNNMEFSDEIARRTVWIRLDAQIERPWKRTGFKHPDLRGWVKEHRAQIVTALLTFVRKWLEAGQPRGEATLGGFESWSQVIGGILKTVGIEGFMKNADDLYDQLDSDRQAWAEFFSAWAERFGAYDPETDSWGAWVETEDGRQWVSNPSPCRSVGTKELFPLASTYDDEEKGETLGLLDGHLGRGNERARRNYLGKLLANTYKDRVFGGYRLEVLKKKIDRATQFRLVNLQAIAESTDESSVFDSFAPEASDNGDSSRAEKTKTESTESKNAPGQTEGKPHHTSQESTPHNECMCDFESSANEAESDSFDSVSTSPAGQEASVDKVFRRNESKTKAFTTDSPQHVTEPVKADDMATSTPRNGSELTREEKVAHIYDAEDWLDLPRSAIDSTWSDARIDALYEELLSKALARWKLIHNQQEPASTASSV